MFDPKEYSDPELYELLRKYDFRGPIWDSYMNYLADHAIKVLGGWIKSGKITGKVRGTGVGCRALVALDTADTYDLAHFAVSAGLDRFGRLLRAEQWDPRGPASLKAGCIQRCLTAYPNAYREWLKVRFGSNIRWQHLPGAGDSDEPGDQRGPWQEPLDAGAEEVVLRDLQVADLLDLLPDDLRAVGQLIANDGVSFAEAARELGFNPKALNKRLLRLRPHLQDKRRELGGEADL